MHVHLADEPNSPCKDPLTRILEPRNVGTVWLIYRTRAHVQPEGHCGWIVYSKTKLPNPVVFYERYQATIRRALCHRAADTHTCINARYAYVARCNCDVYISAGPSNSPLSRLMLRRYATYVSASNHHRKSPYLCVSLLVAKHGFPFPVIIL